jgi:hypothetical protein
MSDEGKIGIIHEIGDMGLGFQELTEEEQKKVEEDITKKRNNGVNVLYP